jgi:hypothetical protein
MGRARADREGGGGGLQGDCNFLLAGRRWGRIREGNGEEKRLWGDESCRSSLGGYCYGRIIRATESHVY